ALHEDTAAQSASRHSAGGAYRAHGARRSCGLGEPAEAAHRSRAFAFPAFHTRQPVRRPGTVVAGAAVLFSGAYARAGQSRLRLQPGRGTGPPAATKTSARLL